MGSEWQERTWGNLATLEYGKGLRGYQEATGSYRVYGTNGPIGWHDEPLCPFPSVVIGRKGAYRGIHFSPEPFFVIDTAFYLNPKEDFDIKWAYYELLTHDINNMDSGSAIPSTSRDSFYRLPVFVPPRHEQRAIAHILGSLDDKIELNRQMNETLEAMARAIFKSWFIDFDPVIDNALRAGNPIPGRFTERAEMRRQMLVQNQPSSPGPFSQGEKGGQYRGGYDFSGLSDTTRELRKKQTTAEKLFWEIVRNRSFLGLKFRRQHQVGDYIVDFYCHEHRLVIELDGGIHNKNLKKDAKRDAYMESLGFTVLRFPNNQVFEDTEGVLAQIAACISSSPSGRGGGEGSMDEIHQLFPDSFEDSELGEIPKGWEVSTLSEIINLIGGGTPKTKVAEYWGGDIPWFSVVDAPRTNDVFVVDTEKHVTQLGVDNSSTRVLRKGTTIISARGTVGKCALVGHPMAMNQSCYGIQGKNGLTDYFIYYKIRRQVADLQRGGHGSVFNTITRDTFKSIRMVSPSPELAMAFDATVQPYMDLILARLMENATLASIRDALLPKLVSGEMRVPDAEKFIKEAGV